jgi:DNA-binding response OmpR family regulator
MNENGHFALVPRPSSAIEKAEPGAKRILSGMVADTLALAKNGKSKPQFLVLAGADHFADLWEVLLKSKLQERYEVRILRFETDAELIRLATEHPFDLVFLYLGNIRWTEFKGQHQKDWLTNDFLLQHMVGTLAHLQRTHDKPIIATQGMDWAHKFSGTGVSFFQAPFRMEDVWPVVEASLAEHSKMPTAIQTPKTRPLRVVIIDDEDGPFHSMRLIITWTFENVRFTWFRDGNRAWRELSRADPDLLITDFRNFGMTGFEMVQRLAQKEVKYPIFLMSAYKTPESMRIIEECAMRLNLTYFPLPFDVATIRAALVSNLGSRFAASAVIKSPKARRLRIVVVYSEVGPFKCLEVCLGNWFKNVTLMPFENCGEDAWQELLLSDPDLLITGSAMDGLRGEEIARRLVERKATYPIVVMSAFPELTEKLLRECTCNAPNVSVLPMPWSMDEAKNLFETALKDFAPRRT